MDAVRLKGLRFFAHHGCKPDEVERGQDFEVDVELRCNLQQAAVADDLNRSLDFDKIYTLVEQAVTGTRFNLLEALGEELCRRLLELHPSVEVRVVIRKTTPPTGWGSGTPEVEMVRAGKSGGG